jgi:hypothetical protein
MEVQTRACFGASILIFADTVGFFHVWHEQRVGGAGVELVIWVLIIIIVDVLNQYWVGCSDGLAIWCWWWLR